MDVGFPVSPQTTCASPRPMIDECIGLWVLKKSASFFWIWGLNSVIELAWIGHPPMKWREPGTWLAG